MLNKTTFEILSYISKNERCLFSDVLNHIGGNRNTQKLVERLIEIGLVRSDLPGRDVVGSRLSATPEGMEELHSYLEETERFESQLAEYKRISEATEQQAKVALDEAKSAKKEAIFSKAVAILSLAVSFASLVVSIVK